MRKRTLHTARLTQTQRDAWTRRLAPLVHDRFLHHSDEQVAVELIWRAPDAVVDVFLDGDTVLGFLSIAVDTVAMPDRTRGCISFGIFAIPGAPNLTKPAFRRAVRTIVAYRLRNPTTELCYVGPLISPAPYRHTRIWPTVYPRPGVQTPAWVEQLFARQAARAHVLVDDRDPGIVRLDKPFAMTQPERLMAYVERSNDPDMNYYVQRNPNYVDGDWLMVYTRMGFRDLAVGALRLPGHLRRLRTTS